MRYIIFLAIVAILTGGCAATKQDFLYAANSTAIHEAFEKTDPYYYKCYQKTKEQANNDIDQLWVEEIAVVSRKFESGMNQKQIKELAVEAMVKALGRYGSESKIDFSADTPDCQRFRTAIRNDFPKLLATR